MKKRALVSLVLALVMVFAMASTALAAFCTNCGTTLPNGANFCSNCGQALNAVPNPAPAPNPNNSSVTITRVNNNNDGTVSLAWTDSGNNSPYTVKYLMKRSGNFDDDFGNTKFIWDAESGLNRTSYDFTELAPGVDYWIVVEDCNGNLAYKAYNAGSMPRFYDFPVEISIDLKYKRNNAFEEVYAFSASDIDRYRNTTNYGAYIRMDYSQLARERIYLCLITITDPNGEVIPDSVGDMMLPQGNYYKYWPFYDLNAVIDHLYEGYEAAPVGTYTFSIYWDGMFVTSQSFRISR